ncbi:NAD(P)-binding protein [Staphylococcus auricularis]|uniref:FAD-dependent monooxygenase n=1 Tax=Staphylococcus auricularis TaxID=29379 RepID=A0AAP8TTE2_9STAP|nr:FAD-dependent monooxygenase [Staphylococcus auricularis]MDC6327616.1 FAD-dependent monooxygenase [Staphylococcus auricularis]MDN4533568.1 FAD-dependent monooxygenase [Staphylococcus auricularis]PNZ68039.1 hypothetical protein CD158_04540 [Staphylococcus auricularis]QPT06573.1 FAD-dependent monooxygenase [Staphylococcus auricularis]SQJ15166.1 Salicylate hydroxylase [Staphylococcus auricularis]
MKIAIVGAGIGGLTAAALLYEQGHEVKVFEKNPQIKAIGAGIGIGNNVLEKLGNHDLAKGIKNVGQLVRELEIRDHKDTLLSGIQFKKNTVNLTMKRQDLIEVIQSYVPDDAIYLNHLVTQVDNGDMKVTLHFSAQESETFDLCLGADGLHSEVRNQVTKDAKVQYQGYTVFRGMVEDMPFKADQVATEYWGSKGRVGIVPLLNNQAYWFIAINTKERDLTVQSYGKPHLQARFNHYPDRVRAVLDKQSETDILHHDMYDLKPLKTFVYQRTILLGDAAHATTPNMGQGAGQAMEDAIVLNQCLASYDFQQALERYDKLRVKHTAKVIKRSRRIGKIAQMRNGLMVGARNTIAKRIPQFMLNRQVNFLYKSKLK